MNGISTHCAFSETVTVHWLTAICSCGQVFTESSPSPSYRSAATSLARKAIKHVSESNLPNEPYDDLKRPPSVEEA
jgi:hypothetical protein